MDSEDDGRAPASAAQWAYQWETYAIESTRQSALTEFHYYPFLPVEIKVEIWKLFFASRGRSAHRFNLTIDPYAQHRLMITPDKGQKSDASDWREILAFARVDRFSFDWLMQFRRRAIVVCKDESPNVLKKYGTGIEVLADPEHDLVTFRFNYGHTQASLHMLDLRANQLLFANLTHIGIEMSACPESPFGRRLHIHAHSQGLVGRKCSPFACPRTWHDDRISCPYGVVNFLRFFQNLKTVYLIIPVSRLPVNPYTTLEMPRFYIPHARSLLSPFRLRLFTQLEQIAEKNEAAQFQNRAGAYCEVEIRRRGSPRDLVFIPASYTYRPCHQNERIPESRRQTEQDFRPFCNHVVDLYRDYHNSVRTESFDWRKTQFKYLAWADLRETSFGGKMVRKRGPWS